MKPIAAILLLLASALLPPVHAQAVYRCGNSYSQAPCEQGRQIEVSDARSRAQQVDAQRVADDEHRLAAQMRHDRLADQRESKPLLAASLSGPAPSTKLASAAGLHDRKKHAFGRPPATTDFVAFDPSSRKRRGGA